MRTLLWKDFWQNSRVLLAVAIVVIVPYAAALITFVAHRLLWSSDVRPFLAFAETANWASVFLSTFMAAFIGGNAIAGERADQSAEFAAGLPIPRSPSVASRAIVAALPCVAMWSINGVVLGTITWLQLIVRPVPFSYSDRVMAMVLYGCCSILLFGIAWFFSSFLKSPAISAALALGLFAAGAVGVSLYFSTPNKGIDDARDSLRICGN